MKDRKIEGIVKVSTKGQIVLPKDVRNQLGIAPGKKLAVAVKDKDVILRKIETLDLAEISERVSDVAERENIDVDKLIDEAIRWVRKQK